MPVFNNVENLPTPEDQVKLDLLILMESTLNQNIKSPNNHKEGNPPSVTTNASSTIQVKAGDDYTATYRAEAYRPDPAGFDNFPNRTKEGRISLIATADKAVTTQVMNERGQIADNVFEEIAQAAGLKKHGPNQGFKCHQGEWGHSGSVMQATGYTEQRQSLNFHLDDIAKVSSAIATLKAQYTAKAGPSADGLSEGNDHSAKQVRTHVLPK